MLTAESPLTGACRQARPLAAISSAFRGTGPLAVAGFALTLAGCSVATVDAPDEEVRTSTHAQILVQRQEAADGTARGDAVASILRLAEDADPEEALAVAGLRDVLPPMGECLLSPSHLAISDTTTLDSVELVPADDIRLSTPYGEAHLVPHAFPTVSDWIHGVVYTSRDRNAATLAETSLYSFVIENADGLGDVSTTQESPSMPTELYLDGRPLADISHLRLDTVLDVNWAPSASPLDAIALVVSSPDASWTCTFGDGDGHAEVDLALATDAQEQSLFSPGSTGTLSVHRIRAIAGTDNDESSVIEVRFDFAAVADITFE